MQHKFRIFGSLVVSIVMTVPLLLSREAYDGAGAGGLPELVEPSMLGTTSSFAHSITRFWRCGPIGGMPDMGHSACKATAPIHIAVYGHCTYDRWG